MTVRVDAIAVIGAGNVGGTLARLWSDAGHRVWLASRRSPDLLCDEAAQLGANVTPIAARDAHGHADVVVLAVPWGRVTSALDAAGDLTGMLLIDATNPYGPGGPRRAGGQTSTEAVAALVPGTRVVKAFNTIPAGRLARDGHRDGSPPQAVPLAGDDAQDKETVATLIRDAGFAPLDTGDLREGGRLQEPGALLYGASGTAAELAALLQRVGDERPSSWLRLRRIAAGMVQARAPRSRG